MKKMIQCRVMGEGMINGGEDPFNDWFSLEHNMTVPNLRLWIAALRSGEYRQCREELYGLDENAKWSDETSNWEGDKGHCCLGVLGSICGFANAELERYSLLQEHLAEVAGMIEEREVDSDYSPGAEENPRILQDLLSTMNDRGWSFVQIADWIEENLIDDEIQV